MASSSSSSSSSPSRIQSTNSLTLIVFSANWCYPFDVYIRQKIKELSEIQIIEYLIYVSNDLETSSTQSFNNNKKVKYCNSIEATELLEKYNVLSIPCFFLINNKNILIKNLTEVIDNSFSKEELSFIQNFCSFEWKEKLLLENPLLFEVEKVRNSALNLFNEGKTEEALFTLFHLLAHTINDTKANYNLSAILQTYGKTRLSIYYMFKVVEFDALDATAHAVLQSVLYLSNPKLVLEGYKELVRHQPNNLRAIHAVASLTGIGNKPDPNYIKQVFDDLSNTFEDKLVNYLDYRVPWQIKEALDKCFPIYDSKWTIVDLGCGTGLCGRLFKTYAEKFIGIDLSPLMIEKCKDANIYTELLIGDFHDLLMNVIDHTIDLVLAADVWIYVGDLKRIFEILQKKLRYNGCLAFSIEKETIKGNLYRLQKSGRFSHSDEYIVSLASRFHYSILYCNDIIVRKEQGESIYGSLYILQNRFKN